MHWREPVLGLSGPAGKSWISLSDPLPDHGKEFFRFSSDLLGLRFGSDAGIVIVNDVPFTPASVKIIAERVGDPAHCHLDALEGNSVVPGAGGHAIANACDCHFGGL